MKTNFKNILIATALLQAPLFASLSDDIKQAVKHSKSNFIKNSYSSNMYESIWIKNGELSTLGKELLSQIKSDKTVASDLPFYKLYKNVQNRVNSGKFNTKLEFKMMKLYKAYMDYLIKGGINWKAFDNNLAGLAKKYDYKVAWEHKTPPYSSKKILNSAILSGSFGNAFSRVEPHRFKYKQLKKYLIKFIDIRNSGNGKGIKIGSTIKVGSSNGAIPAIRKRLKLVGDLNGCSASMDSPIYDSCMAKAIKRYKLRHGLKPSSVIDKAIRNELSHPISYYITKMRLNLDRIKWSNRNEAQVRIELNIPAFRLYLYDGKDLVTTMRVITGKPDHPTAIFSDIMTTVVVNPYWRIPESIVKKEMIKHLLKNPHYYESRGKFLYDGWGPNAKKINPATVNWAKYKDNKKHIPYHFMQNPGYKNALGKIKFLFPNKYSVYIHDTPGKSLFFRNVRAFSHGCMRIQKPRELLEALALFNSNLHVNEIMKQLGTDKNKQIALRRRIPVDITYFTSYVDNYGYLHFRKDIYGYDRLQLKNYYKGYKISGKKESKDNEHSSKKPKKNKNNAVKNETETRVKKAKKSVKKTAHKVKEETYTEPAKPAKPQKDYEVIEIGY